mgnify:CR=1 FL=1
MLLKVSNVLSKEEIAQVRSIIEAAEWVDGNATSGAQAARAKRNAQVRDGSPAARQAGNVVLDALQRSALFVSGALPLKVYPPLFNRYAGGQAFDAHVDNAIRPMRDSDFRVRTDVSATLFLSEPEDYDGGELIIDDTYGSHTVKLSAGSMVLYPSTSLHRIAPVTRGERLASFFWIQSMVRDDGQRALLFDLDTAIQSLHAAKVDHPSLIQLTGVYHNLVRRWADA